MGTRKHSARTAALVALVLGLILLAPAPADAMRRVERATPTVERWVSSRSFTTPYALIKVIHHGHSLTPSPVTRCKVAYSDEDISVLISTCGHRWRVRACYVSMSGRRERFVILYAPREHLRSAGGHRAA